MRRTLTLSLLALTTTFGAWMAYAANPHWKHNSPTFTDNGVTLTASGSIVGVGNQDLKVCVTVTGTPVARCSDKYGNESWGQNPKSFTVTKCQTLTKNGNPSFSITVGPPSLKWQDCGCPSNKPKVTVKDVKFTKAVIVVSQGGKVVLQETRTF